MRIFWREEEGRLMAMLYSIKEMTSVYVASLLMVNIIIPASYMDIDFCIPFHHPGQSHLPSQDTASPVAV